MTSGTQPAGPVALVILDGWGIAGPGPGNAVDLADTPTFDRLWASMPHTTLVASGDAVGLPPGQIGNSEVGHLNLGAGRIVYQDLARIDAAVADGSLATSSVLVDACACAREGTGRLHIIGLASRGGVHSHLNHIQAIVEVAAKAGVATIRVHAITDGRDVSPDASLEDIPALERVLADVGHSTGCDVCVATVIGRYWAMDRDRRWDRTKRAWDLIVHGVGARSATAVDAVRASHESGTTDEFIEPHVIGSSASGSIADGDVVIFANFRPDRARELSHALVDRDFDDFDRGHAPMVHLFTMTQYDTLLGVPVLFDQHIVHETLADVLAGHGINQLHMAETEKYAHVTYFFNGGLEQEHGGETRILVNSPRDVPTYDHKPQMSAELLCDRFCEVMAGAGDTFVIINFANPDMVGHTGSIPATINAVETVDRCLARVVATMEASGGTCLVTADHGNAECMLTQDGRPHTAHTTNPVPLILVGVTSDIAGITLRPGGRLGDIAPTILDLIGIDQPAQMTGETLLVPPGS